MLFGCKKRRLQEWITERSLDKTKSRKMTRLQESGFADVECTVRGPEMSLTNGELALLSEMTV